MIAKKSTGKGVRKATSSKPEKSRGTYVEMSPVTMEYIGKYRKLLTDLLEQIVPGSKKFFEITDAAVIESVLTSAWAASIPMTPMLKKASARKTRKKGS